jgi:hypothetical protein
MPLQTTPDLALRRRGRARAWGVPHRGVVADADDGDHPNCLAGLEARREPDVGGGRAACRGRDGRAALSPGQRTDEQLPAGPRAPWRTISWRPGTKGWRRKQLIAGRWWRVTSTGRRQAGWRLGARMTRGQPEERQYDGSNRPASATLEEWAGYAQRRSAVAPCHEEATGELGWDQAQGRWWPGFHRQTVTVRLADSLLVGLELRPRRARRGRGRPRDPCSPSAGSPEACPPRGASRSRAVATPPGGAVVDHHRSIQRALLTQVLTK